METLADKLALLGRHVERAVAAVSNERAASPVLVAVVGEFAAKYKKATAGLAAGGTSARELVVEVEQAADSAKVGANADPGISEDTRHLVGVAHDAICLVKFEGQ
ncbi:MAG TPA: hypothetical protein VFQ65_25685 [Kofleriaceae bacterium]|nr:hypothetical protein [Kofleriaceae bacterium]